MKRILSILTLILLALTVWTTTATAQAVPDKQAVQAENETPKALEASPLVITTPTGWQFDEKDVNEHRVIVFIDPNSDNRIEIYRRLITRNEHANILFNAFDSRLTDAEMKVFEKNEERTITLENGQSRTGRYYEYNYKSNDIPISVATYMFTTQQVAFIVVGYFITSSRPEGIKFFDTLLSQMIDNSPAE